MPRISALVVLAAAAALASGCASTRSAAGGSSATTSTHDVQVQMDSDGSVRSYQTDYRLRNGDRVQILSDGKVGPL
jgi:type IV pilus biogenesis protein CpaD/CtpE